MKTQIDIELLIDQKIKSGQLPIGYNNLKKPIVSTSYMKFVSSDFYNTNKYSVGHFYKPISLILKDIDD